jgi:predicted RNA-binding protein with PIN domain
VKIVDGHNLIGAAGRLGLALDQPDKEARLLRLLVAYRGRRRSRERMLVVFDGGYGRLAAGPRRYTHAGVEVEWAVGESADALIIRRVQAAPRAREVEVVTADAEVRRRVAAWGAGSTPSREFAERMHAVLGEAVAEAEKPAASSPEEIAAWLERFGE